jgi:hypothetical protein
VHPHAAQRTVVDDEAVVEVQDDLVGRHLPRTTPTETGDGAVRPSGSQGRVHEDTRGACRYGPV